MGQSLSVVLFQILSVISYTSVSEFWVLDMRALSALMFGLKCPVPRGHVHKSARPRYCTAYVFVAGPNKHDVSPELAT